MRRRKTREKKPRPVCYSIDLRYVKSHEWAATGSSIIPTAKIAQSQINSQGIAFVKRGKRAGRPRGSWRVTAFGCGYCCCMLLYSIYYWAIRK